MNLTTNFNFIDMTTITAKQARALSDSANKPLIDRFKAGPTIAELERDIETAAKEGFLQIQVALGHNIHHSIKEYLSDLFNSQGFYVEYEHDKTLCTILISWE
jgi:hypothetical protein